MTTATLADLCSIFIGRTPSRSEPKYWGGDVPWLSIADMKQGRDLLSTKERVTVTARDECNLRLIEPGTVVMSFKLSIGKVGIARTHMATNEAIAALPVKDSGRLDPHYLSRVLESMDHAGGANRAAMGGTLNKASLSAIRLPVPPIAEQRRIAAILDKADDLRAKRRQAIAHLDALTQSTFHSMFGDPVSNDLNWPLEPFGQVTTSRLGKMLDKKAQTGTHRFRYLRNANVQWFQINTDDLFEMDFSPADQIEFALRRGDVLVCEGGEPGRAAVWEDQSPGCYFQKALHRVRPKLDVIHPQYVVHLLWALANGGGLKDHVTVATIAHLTGEKLKRMHIPVPPIGLQQTFANRIAAVERLKENHRKHLAELDALFASLQSRAFKGEL